MTKKLTKKAREAKNLELQKSAYKYFAIITVFFFATAIIGGVMGDLLDRGLGIKPVGSVISLTLFYIVSLILAKKLIDKFSK